ncbi:hypothetical protein EHO58_19395 [Leptospira selangorensis]|nr:hypothetical protein EHO58_19395 [Leptospira selangorensis]
MQSRRLTIGLALRFGMLSHPRSRLRHISLCHSSCKASLAPSACALAKRRQPLVVRRNMVKKLCLKRFYFQLPY